jgi:hypothetical protein
MPDRIAPGKPQQPSGPPSGTGGPLPSDLQHRAAARGFGPGAPCKGLRTVTAQLRRAAALARLSERGAGSPCPPLRNRQMARPGSLPQPGPYRRADRTLRERRRALTRQIRPPRAGHHEGQGGLRSHRAAPATAERGRLEQEETCHPCQRAQASPIFPVAQRMVGASGVRSPQRVQAEGGSSVWHKEQVLTGPADRCRERSSRWQPMQKSWNRTSMRVMPFSISFLWQL